MDIWSSSQFATVKRLVTKALSDKKISHDDYLVIQIALKDYRKMKTVMRTTDRCQFSDFD